MGIMNLIYSLTFLLIHNVSASFYYIDLHDEQEKQGQKNQCNFVTTQMDDRFADFVYHLSVDDEDVYIEKIINQQVHSINKNSTNYFMNSIDDLLLTLSQIIKPLGHWGSRTVLSGGNIYLTQITPDQFHGKLINSLQPFFSGHFHMEKFEWKTFSEHNEVFDIRRFFDQCVVESISLEGSGLNASELHKALSENQSCREKLKELSIPLNWSKPKWGRLSNVFNPEKKLMDFIFGVKNLQKLTIVLNDPTVPQGKDEGLPYFNADEIAQMLRELNEKRENPIEILFQ